MITINLSGNENDVQKAAFVIEQLFDGVQETSNSRGVGSIDIQLTAQNLPNNQALIALLKSASWQSTMDEVWKLAEQPVVGRDQLKRLQEGIEAASQLAGDFEEIEERITKEVSEALAEIERIEGAAVGYILNAAHPALKVE